MNLLILILATWRISSLLSNPEERGPWSVCDRLRHLAGVHIDDAGNAYGTNELARAMTCPWCISIWLGVAWTVLDIISPKWARRLALPFALSAGAITINEVLNGAS
jgi:hypothetical protein